MFFKTVGDSSNSSMLYNPIVGDSKDNKKEEKILIVKPKTEEKKRKFDELPDANKKQKNIYIIKDSDVVTEMNELKKHLDQQKKGVTEIFTNFVDFILKDENFYSKEDNRIYISDDKSSDFKKLKLELIKFSKSYEVKTANAIQEVLAKKIASLITQHKISFPFQCLYPEAKKTVETEFKKLKSRKWTVEKTNEGFNFKFDYSYCPKFDPTDSKVNKLHDWMISGKGTTGLSISRQYSEMIRYMCGGQTGGSPVTAWHTSGGLRALRQVLKHDNEKIEHNFGPINSEKLNTLFLRTFQAFSDFQPRIALDIIDFLIKELKMPVPQEGLCMLDSSAGWGGRVIAAILHEKVRSYTGIDPNRKLEPVYSNIKRDYEDLSKTKIEMIYKAAEIVLAKYLPLGEGKYDFLLTSPPYGDCEHYTQDEDQSWQYVAKHGQDYEKGKEEWLNKFLFPSLKNSYDAVKPGGFFAINISDYNYKQSSSKHVKICGPMLSYLTETLKMEYIGALGMTLARKTGKGEPVWILKK